MLQNAETDAESGAHELVFPLGSDLKRPGRCFSWVNTFNHELDRHQEVIEATDTSSAEADEINVDEIRNHDLGDINYE